MEPTKYANMDNARPHERASLLLDIEQHSNPRASEDTNPFVDDPLAADDDHSSKESRHGSEAYGTPLPGPTPLPPAPASDAAQPGMLCVEHGCTRPARGARGPDGLPLPVTAIRSSSDMAFHFLALGPKLILALVWFCALIVWGAMSIVYLVWWLFLQGFTGFTRVRTDRYMVRRDVGAIFDMLMDFFEEIW